MAVLEVITQPELGQTALLPPRSDFAWIIERETALASAAHDTSPVLVAEIEIQGRDEPACMTHPWQGKFLDLFVRKEDYGQFLSGGYDG